MSLTTVPTGVPAGAAYVVNMDEDRWLSFTDTEQATCREAWSYATKESGLEMVVLRLTPDPLFPTGGNEQAYIAWQERLVRKDFTIDTTATVNVPTTATVLSPIATGKIMAKLREIYPVGTKWKIVNLDNVKIDNGKL